MLKIKKIVLDKIKKKTICEGDYNYFFTLKIVDYEKVQIFYRKFCFFRSIVIAELWIL